MADLNQTALRGGRSFAQAVEAISAIEGILSPFSMQMMDCVLSLQAEQNIQGGLIEFGVYKGRSAALIGCHVRPNEDFILVDVADELDAVRLHEIQSRFEFVLSSSEEFKQKFRRYSSLRGNCRFIHIDSGHAYRTTLAELALAEELIAPGGVVVLDDFVNLNYSQILAATYKYLYTAETCLTMFLVTAEKGYLCRKDDYDMYGRYVLSNIVDELEKRGNPNCCLARTDIDPEYRAFHLRHRMSGETDRKFGIQIYKHFFEQP